MSERARTSPPILHATNSQIPDFLQGGHAMGERIRAFDWSSHPLGPPAQWPIALQMAMSLCLNSSFPTAVYWGPSMFTLYNDAWSEIPAERHPAALGQPAAQLWSDIWHVVGPQFEGVLANGEGVALYEQHLPMVRGGQARDTWWNYSLTALRNPDGSVAGIFNQGNEVTQAVLARRERTAEIDRLTRLFGQAPAPIAWLRGPDHVFEIANEAYVRLIGGRDVVGKPLREALPEVVDQGFLKLLDEVFRSAEPYIGVGTKVQLARQPGAGMEEAVVDFIYQPVQDAAGQVDGIFVLVTDVTERSRAEAALRITNWQLDEERARLAALVEAEQRAQNALRRFNDTLEATVRARTDELSRSLAAQNTISDRLRATFQTSLILQGYLDRQGTLLDANRASLEVIGARLQDVLGEPFWNTPWFTGTPGMPERMKEAVEAASQGVPMRSVIEVNVPAGWRRFDFSLRPVYNDSRELVGIVPEAVDITSQPRP